MNEPSAIVLKTKDLVIMFEEFIKVCAGWFIGNIMFYIHMLVYMLVKG